MAQAQWTAAVVGIILACGGCDSVSATQPERTVAVTLIDKTQLPSDLRARAASEVEVIFAAAGVRLKWQVPSQPAVPVLAAGRGLTLMIVSNHDPVTARNDCILGRAVAALSSGYVFYNRIIDATADRPVDVAVVLARVMAHELGHLLLPARGHSSYGIMRGDLDLGFTNPDRFTADEVRRMHAVLTARLSQR
jgi:hypothetical protein